MGSAVQLVGFRTLIQDAQEKINVEWQNHKNKEDAFIAERCVNADHQKIVYMDTNYKVSEPEFCYKTEKWFKRLIV